MLVPVTGDLALAGGEAAIREPWRLAVAALLDAGEPADLVTHAQCRTIAQLLASGIASPRATGAGRWFDAFAALLGVRERITYEAQAAIELEALARQHDTALPYPFAIEKQAAAPFVVDLRPAVRALASAVRRGDPRDLSALRVYETMAQIISASCTIARRDHHLDVVALSGGCFQSALLTERTTSLLEAAGFQVLVHRLVPPNDGGIALGQAAIAAHTLLDDPKRRGDESHVPRNTW